MNADPVARNLRLERWLMPDEENFYRWVEPTRQAVGAVVCAGTSFLMRRSALLQVGGFETGTSSEDLATGIRLAAAGYRNLYLNEKAERWPLPTFDRGHGPAARSLGQRHSADPAHRCQPPPDPGA